MQIASLLIPLLLAAGAVLFCAFVAVIIGLIIFIPYLSNVFNK